MMEPSILIEIIQKNPEHITAVGVFYLAFQVRSLKIQVDDLNSTLTNGIRDYLKKAVKHLKNVSHT